MKAFVIAMKNEAAVVRPFLKDDDRLYVAGVGKVNAAAAAQNEVTPLTIRTGKPRLFRRP